MTVRTSILGRERLGAALRRTSGEVVGAAARAVRAGAEDLRDTARDVLDEPGGGRPSAPGEPPHRQTGQLRDSVFVRTSDDGLTAEVGTDLDHGAHLEFGTQDTPARPWLLPAFEIAKPRITKRIARALADVRNRGSGIRAQRIARSSNTDS